MKKNQIRKSVAALAMAAVVSVSLLGYGCGSKSASSTAGVSGEFTGTAKGMGGDVTVTLTLTDGKITGCTAEGKDETPGIGTMLWSSCPAPLPRAAALPWTAWPPQPSPPTHQGGCCCRSGRSRPER